MPNTIYLCFRFMKKIVVYIAFLVGLLYSNLGNATGLELNTNSKSNDYTIILNNFNSDVFKFSEVTSTSLNEKVFTDNDTNEENDETHENHELSIKKICFVNFVSEIKNFNSKVNFVYNNKSFNFYSLDNFSRIPRFNYLSLNVFRI